MSAGRLGLLLKALLVCGAVVALDQLSKGLIRASIDPGERVEVLPFLKLANTRNSGVAFGFAGGVSPLLIGVAIAFLVALMGYLVLRSDPGSLIWLPTGLLVGGALGNLADRVRDGAVTDFIDLPVWPTFNIADIAITLGVIALVLLPERRRE